MVYAKFTLNIITKQCVSCLLYTSDAADERSSVDLGGRRIIKKKTIDQSSDIMHDHKTKEKNKSQKIV